ncbi:GNAT family N-acetyltransferase [bacterium]|nr:GNAT family N-acetyltransferase [candidate division CSSED10-310 bacterium]
MENFLVAHWGSAEIVTRGKMHHAGKLPGFICMHNHAIVGLITYRILNDSCEIITLNSLIRRCGIGSALMDAVKQEAYRKGCRRLWLITTNDNTPAIRFYQKWGMHITDIYPDAMVYSRKLKPSIPRTGCDGIPIRDEIEMEIGLDATNPASSGNDALGYPPD